MFDILEVGDISQLVLKKQLRNNASLLYLIKGVHKLEEAEDIIKIYSSKCGNIYFNKGIEKPTYDETNEIISRIGNNLRYDFDNISQNINNVFVGLNRESQKILSESFVLVFNECLANNVSPSMLKNGYIRCLVTLNKRVSNIIYNLDKDNRILFIGKPDKFDILCFTILGLCGVDVVICDFDVGITSECLCRNRFVLLDGPIKDVNIDYLSYIDKGIRDINKNTIISNEWVNFKDYKDLEDILKLYNFKIDDRLEQDKWKVLHLEVQGVSDKQVYSNQLETFLMNTMASNRKFMVFDNEIPKATYDETEKYKLQYKDKGIIDIFSKYSVFKDSGVGAQIEIAFKKLCESKKFENERQSSNYQTVLKIWLIRYLDMFFTDMKIDKIPLVISFSKLTERENEFIEILSYLPLDVLCLYPDYSVAYNLMGLDKTYKAIVIGNSDSSIIKYPKNTGVGKVATIAYNAEKELDTVLYSDTSLFKIRQFKDINSIVLKTTYEEVGILWNEPAKFRPSFESVGNLVTVPTIFVKINGVNETYQEDIRKLLGSNTLFFDKYPIQLQPSIIDNGLDFRQFTKQLIFKSSIDFERLKNSKYYNYAVYSEETQSLIFEKVQKLVELNWCATSEKNLAYIILDTVFRLPSNILQMIHNYDFTADIPKIVIYNGSTSPCTLQDCILIMFLKLIGFDIVILAPTGYRVVEQYISNQWFNEITIGQFDFSLNELNLNNDSSSFQGGKKQGFFSRLFN